LDYSVLIPLTIEFTFQFKLRKICLDYSTSEYVFMMGLGAVSWSSKKQ